MYFKNDLTGKKIGRWTVIGYSHTQNRNHYWKVICECGTEGTRPTRTLNNHSKSCGCLQRDLCKAAVGEKAKNWKGGYRYLAKGAGGYIQMMNPKTRKRTYEHIYIMEQHMGRELLKHETVHHKNGVRTDNRIENLELWSSSQPSGQRIEDKIQYWREQLAFYAPHMLQQEYQNNTSERLVSPT